MPGGKVVLAGGNELRPGCEEMDERVLRDAGGRAARVVFLPTAVARYDPVGSGRGAVAYFGRLGAHCEVAMILSHDDANRPDMAALIDGATLVYLGGGEPQVLLDALRSSLAWDAALSAFERGAVVGGSSAGAMVVCSHTLLPGQRTPGQRAWVDGLGLVRDALVMPHFDAARAPSPAGFAATLAQAVSPAFALFGIPEQSALLGAGRDWEVAGAGPVTVFQSGQSQAHGQGQLVTLALSPA
jgi:cyanophycinase